MWITHETSGHEAGLFQFKKSVSIASMPEKAEMRLSADTKYRLYINGNFVQAGPSKRSEFYSFYDTIDLLPYIKAGENEISIYVLHLDPVPVKGNGRGHVETMISGPFLGVAAVIKLDENTFVTDDSWLVSFCPEFTILPPTKIKGGASMAGIFQEINFNNAKRDFTPASILTTLKSPWINEYFTDVFEGCGETHFYHLIESPIPPLTYIEQKFVNYENFSGKDTSFVLNAGVHSTGAVKFKVKGTKGTKITLTYAEAYWKQKEGADRPHKEVRDDESGFLFGSEDVIILDENEQVFETFFWQCFRFIEVKIEGEATLSDIKFFKMNYPLNSVGKFVSSDEDSEKMWEISIRTLNNCMHDSFEDCPYYEQLQYVMDSRLQALYLRHLTDDKRLIIKCIDDFNEGRFPDGMIPARTPSLRKQRIPGFGLHYIYMLHDHMLYERDTDRIADLLPVADGVLRYFEKRQKNGVVGILGNWNYIDWVSTWSGGIPTNTGSIAVYSFMLIVAYENAAEMADFIGRKGLAEEYREKAETLRKNAKAYFYDENKKMFRDYEENIFSMHSQIWAVLADVVTGDDASDLLQRTYDDKELPVCSYSMMYFVFRAYEKSGLYHIAYKMLDNWREMIGLNATTWFESSPFTTRSDCHAWSSVPIYEFAACILGVKPTVNEVIVKPYVYANDYANGTVMSPIGEITVDWKKENGTLTLKVTAPEKVKIILPDNTEYFEKELEVSCKI